MRYQLDGGRAQPAAAGRVASLPCRKPHISTAEAAATSNADTRILSYLLIGMESPSGSSVPSAWECSWGGRYRQTRALVRGQRACVHRLETPARGHQAFVRGTRALVRDSRPQSADNRRMSSGITPMSVDYERMSAYIDPMSVAPGPSSSVPGLDRASLPKGPALRFLK
jgi:hypothetical protein